MHPAFQIETSGSRTLIYDQCILLVDAGERHFCFAIMMAETREFIALEYYQVKSGSREEDWKELISNNPLLRQRYRSVHIFYNNNQGILVPGRFFNQDSGSQMLEMVNGDRHTGILMHDNVEEMELHLIYTVPAFLHEEISRIFPDAIFSHFHSGWIKRKFLLQGKTDVMEVIFYPEMIIIALWINNALHIIQSFVYDIPEDVSYHLLNICHQWGISPEEINLEISGLLETQSAMFSEILKYFLHVELETRSILFRYDFEFDKFPQHFFSPVFSLALCV